MKNSILLLLWLALSIPATAGVLVADVATYEPPAFFDSYKPRHDPGDDPFSGKIPATEYLGKDNSDTHFRQLNAATQAVGFKIGEGHRITYSEVSDNDLKKLMMETFAKSATNSPEVEEVNIAGHKAFQVHCVVPMPQVHVGTIFIYDSIWIRLKPNQILELRLVGSDAELLKTVRDSLATIKFLPPVAHPAATALPITKAVPQLGDVRADVFKVVGKPIFSTPSDDIYYTGKYILRSGYNMPNIIELMYVRTTEVEPFVEATKADNLEKMLELTVPLQKEEIQELLAQHSQDTAGKKLEWRAIKDNRWQRSDGAMAGYQPDSKYLIIATKEIWPNLGGFTK